MNCQFEDSAVKTDPHQPTRISPNSLRINQAVFTSSESVARILTSNLAITRRVRFIQNQDFTGRFGWWVLILSSAGMNFEYIFGHAAIGFKKYVSGAQRMTRLILVAADWPTRRKSRKRSCDGPTAQMEQRTCRKIPF